MTPQASAGQGSALFLEHMDDAYTSTLDGADNEASTRQLHSPTTGNPASQPSTISSLSRPDYRSSNDQSIEPSLEGEDLAEANGAHPILDGTTAAQLEQQQQEQRDQQHFAGRLFTESPATAHWHTPTLTFASTEAQHLPQTSPNDTVHDALQSTSQKRTLPSRDVTEETIEDAYVLFILYCNPTIPIPDDSMDLKRGFRNPPRSDGKSFSTYALFELVRKLDDKEIKSWSQLVLKLGVEPPIAEKNQSAQKVQQYAVRLKRWMRAMHLDAFFKYCNGKPHAYYTDIPLADEPQQESRDGVPRDEDLALRALQPESRPKRGRKKADDKDGDIDLTLSPSKRPRIGTPSDAPDFENFGSDPSALFSSSAVPSTGQDEDIDRFAKQLDPWTETPTMTAGPINSGLFAQSPTNRANSGSFGAQQFRWRLNVVDNTTTPSIPYPQSAITPTSHLPDSMFAEPLSAITPASSGARGRVRRRHGPAVSSAWPSGGSTLTGKFRGRPPSNRSIRDGPFSTFPANPKTREGPVIDLQRSQVSTPVTSVSNGHWGGPIPQPTPQPAPQPSNNTFGAKPTKRTSLQLHVPERKGGPVRLATPIGSVNGASKNGPTTAAATAAALIQHSDDGASDSEMFLTRHAATGQFSNRRQDLVEGLAARLVQATLLAEPSLDSARAKQVAEKALENLRLAYAEPVDDERFVADCVLWFGLPPHELRPYAGAKSHMADLQVRLTNHEHRNTTTSIDASTTNDDLDIMNTTTTTIDSSHGVDADDRAGVAVAQKLILSWKLNVGPLSATVSLPVSLPLSDQRNGDVDVGGVKGEGEGAGLMKDNNNKNNNVTGLMQSTMPNDHANHDSSLAKAGGESWKDRYRRLEREQTQEKARVRRAIIDALF